MHCFAKLPPHPLQPSIRHFPLLPSPPAVIPTPGFIPCPVRSPSWQILCGTWHRKQHVHFPKCTALPSCPRIHSNLRYATFPFSHPHSPISCLLSCPCR